VRSLYKEEHRQATGRRQAQDVFKAGTGRAVSNVATVHVDLESTSSGVLYALGAYSGGLALWVDQGTLHYEYNLFQIERTRLQVNNLPTGKVTIEVETNIAHPRGSGEVTIRVNGREAAKGTVPRTAPLAFTANDAFDVGTDSFSPVSEAYFDRKPFTFNGNIDKVHIKYLH
jgi:hypothetical protein